MDEYCKYLEITISTKNIDLDLKRQERKMYTNANLLMKEFSSCSVSVKCYLNKTYCSTLYCAPICSSTAPKRLVKNSLRRFKRLQ